MKKLLIGIEPIWLLNSKEYCQKCYFKLFEKCKDCNKSLKGKEFKIHVSDVVCLTCYKIRKAVLQERDGDEYVRTPFGLINRKIATLRSKSNQKIESIKSKKLFKKKVNEK